MFISLLTKLSISSTIAVDIGSFYTKSSIFNSTLSPKISENLESKRLTPSFVAFRIRKGMDTTKTTPLEPEEVEEAIPSIGNKALSLMELRPFMGSGYFPYFCDLKEEKSKEFSEKVITNSSITRFSYEDTFALYMQLYASSVISERDSKQVGLIVPSTWTIRQRKIAENAIRNAKLKFTGIVDDDEAVFTYYAVERIRHFHTKPHTVLFVDVGASSIKSYAARFSLVRNEKTPTANVNVTKLSYSISNEEGGSFVTSRIMNHFIEKLNLKDLSDSEKRRLFSSCEKIKTALSLPNVQTTQQYVEDIDGKDELRLVMTKKEMTPLVDPLLKQLKEVVTESTKDLEIDNIQIIGGSTRLPGIINTLQETLNKSVFTTSI